jgi:hypothetical protein
MIGATDAWNRLVARLCAASAGDNMNVLLGFIFLAFHRHHDIALVGHRWVAVRILPRVEMGQCANTAIRAYFRRARKNEIRSPLLAVRAQRSTY